MKTLNRIMVIGNLGSDPEIKKLDNGLLLVNFSVATSSYMGKDSQGESKYVTHWHKVTAFGKQAELIHQYTKRGSKLMVEGEMRYRNYENKEGVKVYMSEIMLNDFLFLDSKSREQEIPNY